MVIILLDEMCGVEFFKSNISEFRVELNDGLLPLWKLTLKNLNCFIDVCKCTLEL